MQQPILLGRLVINFLLLSTIFPLLRHCGPHYSLHSNVLTLNDLPFIVQVCFNVQFVFIQLGNGKFIFMEIVDYFFLTLFQIFQNFPHLPIITTPPHSPELLNFRL